jgi:hypothetical protein
MDRFPILSNVLVEKEKEIFRRDARAAKSATESASRDLRDMS